MDGNNSNQLKNRAISGIIWRLLERLGARGVSFVVSIVLARLLDPDVYGIVALTAVFTAILGVFVDSGMGNALIQKKGADDLDFSSVFYFNMVMCISLYCLLYLASPWIARFYNMPELTPVIRITGLTLVISGIKNIQQAYVFKHLLFKRFFFATLGGTIGAAVVGIWMAYRGFGVWALVAQGLFNSTVDTIILWVTVKWRPKWMFSFIRLKGLFSYGWKLLISSLLDNVYFRLRSLVIGKIYTPKDLAFYEKGTYFPSLLSTNINASIDSVLLPVMSKNQDDKVVLKNMTRRAIKTSSYIIWPAMMGLAACAEPLVTLLITDKWLPCVPFMRICCITYAFYPIHTANLNAINAMGRSDIFLKLEILKKAVGMVLLLGTMRISVMAMAYSLLVSSAASQIINSWPNRKLLNYSYEQQLKDIFPSMILSGVMFFIVWSVQLLHLGVVLTLLIQIPLGVVIYIAGSKLFRLESYDYILQTTKGFLRRR